MKNKEQTNACYGCFGAANGDCDECDKNRSNKDEKIKKNIQKILWSLLAMVMILLLISVQEKLIRAFIFRVVTVCLMTTKIVIREEENGQNQSTSKS